MNLLINGKMRKIAKVMVYTTLIFSFLNIVQIPEASARFHFRGGNVHDSSRYKQMIEWVKKEQEKLEQIKARLQHSIDTVKQAQQAIQSVKSSIDHIIKNVNTLRSNVNSVMKMSNGLIHLDLNNPEKGWEEVQYSPQDIHYEYDYIKKKVDNNHIVGKANLESQKIAIGLSSIADSNNSIIESLRKLGNNTNGLLDIQEVDNEMDIVTTDTVLQNAKTRANAINKDLQEKIIQYENELAANKRRAKDFQVTSDPEQRTEKEKTDLKRMDVDSKPGRGFVEF